MRCAAWTVMVLLLAGVSSGELAAADSGKGGKPSGIMVARHAKMRIGVDGALSEEAWGKAESYALTLSSESTQGGEVLQEGGLVKLLWDESFLYIGIQFHDSDIVAEGDRDQMAHYLLGDLAEVFLKPADNTCYWELYVTPRGNKTAYWFPGAGRLGLKSNEDYEMELLTGAQCQGTLNDWRDRDTLWTAEMAVPVRELTRYGDAFGPGQKWRILVSRYNYSRYLDRRGPELSMTPKLPITSFHYHAGYAELWLEE